MIDPAPALDPRIVTLPATSELLLITGEALAGKTEALVQRAAALLNGVAPERAVVAATRAPGARALAERIAARLEPERRAAFGDAPFAGITLDTLAFAIVRDGAAASGLAPDVELLEPYETEEVFERAAAPLFSAEWADYLGADVDPEISGLRAPDRFAAAVLRLIVKLRDAGIGPDDVLARSLRGATAWYGKPPNLADPALLMATRDEYRSSLAVGRDELERQRRREIDLAKIVVRLYRSYLDALVEQGCLGRGDVLAEAIRILGEQPELARSYREKLAFAVVDDAHDMRTGEVELLKSLFGPKLAGVTLAGSVDAAIHTFAGTRPETTFRLAATTIALGASRTDPAIAAAARAIVAGDATARIGGDAVRVVRYPDRAAEAGAVAAAVAEAVAAGTPPERIAVLHASARTLSVFDEALVARNVPVALHGDIDLLARHDAGDALAMLWSAVDPFRHAWLLRALQSPIVGLADASLAVLCGEPADPQAMLFPLAADDPDSDRRWDRRRDLRLATNVLAGERDADLTPLARERVVAFRARRARWAAHARDAGVRAAAGILHDAGIFAARPGEEAARTERRTALAEALLALIARFGSRRRGATLDEALAMLERVAAAERGPAIDDERTRGVFVGAIAHVGPRRFEHVFVVDVRAGSFPPYYVPDAFLFSAQHGMIPKDAAGDGTASRTAKFTWYSHTAKLRDLYAKEHRRMLALALTRADRSVTVSASGKPTRGVGMPELASELASMCG
jgi:superfamily I DNA/RNA helicase